eukprot:3366744-Rhodomonas_salina.3
MSTICSVLSELVPYTLRQYHAPPVPHAPCQSGLSHRRGSGFDFDGTFEVSPPPQKKKTAEKGNDAAPGVRLWSSMSGATTWERDSTREWRTCRSECVAGSVANA